MNDLIMFSHSSKITNYILKTIILSSMLARFSVFVYTTIYSFEKYSTVCGIYYNLKWLVANLDTCTLVLIF